MNPLPPDTTVTDDLRWRLHLAALPQVDAPDALWARLQQAQAQARAPRRAAWPWLASAAALVVAVVAVQMLRTPQELGAGVASVPVPAGFDTSALDPSARAGLLRLDAELARAYEQGADSTRLDALRQARTGVVDSFATAAPAELVQL